MSFCKDGFIKQMDKAMIETIVKGDVIESVVDVVKEIIENSLDAKSTEIEIRLTANGLSVIQVNDNGSGILSEDLPFVCQHFTTSKLNSCMDLNALSTLGFRGEALSAISCLSRLKILTKTCSDKCAFVVKYINGKPQNDPYPCAGNVGTQVTVENLFYNSSLRESLKRNAHLNLHNTIYLSKCFAIHYCHVGFLFKLIDNDEVVLKTMPNSTSIDNIRLLYDQNVSRELITIDENDNENNFRLKGLISNASFSMKNFVFNLFINNRFVKWSQLKKVVDDIYEEYLSKNKKPFVYLSLDIDSGDLVVNYHAKKSEILIMNENEICKKIGSILKYKLLSQNQSRTFYMQSNVLDVNRLNSRPYARAESFFFDPVDFSDDQYLEVNKMPIKMHSSNQSHDGSQMKSLTKAVDHIDFLPFDPHDFDEQQPTKKLYAFCDNQKSPMLRIKESAMNLTSVANLRSLIKQNMDSHISNILFDSEFSGCIDFKYFLIQKDSKIFLCKTEHILIDYLYQKVLFHLRNLNILSFDKPISIVEIFDALPIEKWSKVSKSQAYNILIQLSSILSQYFSMEINKSFRTLEAVPELFDQYKPEIKELPNFLFELVNNLNWTDEMKVIDSITKQITQYYLNSFKSTCDKKSDQWEHFFELVLFPELKTKYFSTKKIGEEAVIVEVADLDQLCSSFERC